MTVRLTPPSRRVPSSPHNGHNRHFFCSSPRRSTHEPPPPPLRPPPYTTRRPFFFLFFFFFSICRTPDVFESRVDPRAKATRIVLDEEYMLLLWKHNSGRPNRICDIFWLKRAKGCDKCSKCFCFFQRASSTSRGVHACAMPCLRRWSRASTENNFDFFFFWL